MEAYLGSYVHLSPVTICHYYRLWRKGNLKDKRTKEV